MTNRFLTNPLVPFTDEELRDLWLDDVDGIIVAISLEEALKNVKPLRMVEMFDSRYVCPKLHNLLLAAPFLYRASANVVGVLENWKTMLDAVSTALHTHTGTRSLTLDTVLHQMQETQDGVMKNCRIATDGPEKVIKEMMQPY